MFELDGYDYHIETTGTLRLSDWVDGDGSTCTHCSMQLNIERDMGVERVDVTKNEIKFTAHIRGVIHRFTCIPDENLQRLIAYVSEFSHTVENFPGEYRWTLHPVSVKVMPTRSGNKKAQGTQTRRPVGERQIRIRNTDGYAEMVPA